MNKKQRILKLLESGRSFSVKQLAGLADTTEKSVTGRITELRGEGYAIYLNSAKNGTAQYRLGTPSRNMVRAAHAVFGAQMFQ
jgi:biotin operon repressor